MADTRQEPAFYDYSRDDEEVAWHYVTHTPTSAVAAQWEASDGTGTIRLFKPNKIRGWTIDIEGHVSPVAAREALELAELIMQDSDGAEGRS